jgi:hypothetical protein
MLKPYLCIPLLLICTALAQLPPANYEESEVGTYTLPDPLVFNNGKPVKTAKDWTKRRAEILELFEINMFGHSPKPRQARFEVVDSDRDALDGKALRTQVTIYFSDKNDGPRENLLIYIPTGVKKPVPVFLTLNFQGNQSVVNDPGVKLPMVWDYKTHEQRLATEDSRGRNQELQVEKTLQHGYGFATISYQDIEPDFKGGLPHGIRALFYKPRQTEPATDEWGAIGAWAYGLSRAMDYLEKDKNVDAKRVAIMGHSRLGKTALWAGALDTRFAMVISNCSGEGGASLSRRDYGETIHNLVDSFPYWFDGNYRRFDGHADQLPVDAHELIALIAPRPVYITAAEDDQWADPKGMFLAAVAAGPVYKLLGAQDLETDQMPPLNQPIMHTIAFHVRDGKHEVTAYDWEQFLAFADKKLR